MSSEATRIKETEAIVRLEARVSGLEDRFGGVERAIGKLTESVNTSSRTNWSLVISLMSMAAVFLGGGWYMIKLQTENTVAPVATRSEIGERDRFEIRKQVDKLVETAGDNKASIAHVVMSLAEIESQVRALENYSSVQFADVYRTISPVWQKVMGVPYPEGPHFNPGISKQKDIQLK